MNEQTQAVQRVIGFDSHPDSFTAALLRGPTPAAAIVEKIFNKVPMAQLQSWAKKHTTPEDLIVLESSGNSFQVVRELETVSRRGKVLESVQMGKLKEAHANNDKISAVRIGKAYLAGTAKEVWVPDARTQERRDWFHAYRKAVKRTSQVSNRLDSYLSDNGVRLPANTKEEIQKARVWTPRQWQVIEGLLKECEHADWQREHWSSLMAQEVLQDPELLSMVRLCGVRTIVAFAVGAFVGDIKRFASPKKLVKYVGLDPAFDDSGESEWSGGIGGHGRSDLRSLLIESAQAILRSSKTPLAHWGKKLLARKGAINLVVAAMARKLTIAIWYLLMGRWTPLEEIDERLEIKVSKMISQVGSKGLEQLKKNRKDFRQEIHQRLKAGRVYVLDPAKTFGAKPAGPNPVAPAMAAATSPEEPNHTFNKSQKASRVAGGELDQASAARTSSPPRSSPLQPCL
jgi:transposase